MVLDYSLSVKNMKTDEELSLFFYMFIAYRRSAVNIKKHS